jgi:dTDP-D-glucose 4,6-dehydratase
VAASPLNSDAELSNIELTHALLECCGADWDMVAYVEDRKGHDRRYSLDDSLLRGMGYRARVPFGKGLKDTVCWYRENRHWWEPLKRPRSGRPCPGGDAHGGQVAAATGPGTRNAS